MSVSRYSMYTIGVCTAALLVHTIISHQIWLTPALSVVHPLKEKRVEKNRVRRTKALTEISKLTKIEIWKSARQKHKRLLLLCFISIEQFLELSPKSSSPKSSNHYIHGTIAQLLFKRVKHRTLSLDCLSKNHHSSAWYTTRLLLG